MVLRIDSNPRICSVDEGLKFGGGMSGGRSAYDTSSRFVDFDRPAKEIVGDCESFWGKRRGEDNFCPDCGTDAASCKDCLRDERCQPGSLFPLSSPLIPSLSLSNLLELQQSLQTFGQDLVVKNLL